MKTTLHNFKTLHKITDIPPAHDLSSNQVEAIDNLARVMYQRERKINDDFPAGAMVDANEYNKALNTQVELPDLKLTEKEFKYYKPNMSSWDKVVLEELGVIERISKKEKTSK